MARTALVLGAGMVGTCTALHLQQRGFDVCLVDRRAPGLETSFGNAGMIQREAVEPHAFPREPSFILGAALGLKPEVNWHWRGLLQMGGALLSYYRHSHPAAHARATAAYSQLIAHATSEHTPLIHAAGADDLIARVGLRYAYRTQQALEEALARAEGLHRQFGIRYAAQDGATLAKAEPNLLKRMAGAVHWLDTWSAKDPGALVQRYAKLFVDRGGKLLVGDANTLAMDGAGWSVKSDAGRLNAQHAVLSLGPWADQAIRPLGYRYPLFLKRGYHQHYAVSKSLNVPLLDAERGYVLAPTARGMRLTTGAEFAPIDAPSTPVQIEQTTRLARELIELGPALDMHAWRGARPCTADMLPVMGPAPKHANLWFNFGHSHQGFTLGPIAGKLLAQMMADEQTEVDMTPYLPTRFR